jgi:hypothetical protein
LVEKHHWDKGQQIVFLIVLPVGRVSTRPSGAVEIDVPLFSGDYTAETSAEAVASGEGLAGLLTGLGEKGVAFFATAILIAHVDVNCVVIAGLIIVDRDESFSETIFSHASGLFGTYLLILVDLLILVLVACIDGSWISPLPQFVLVFEINHF